MKKIASVLAVVLSFGLTLSNAQQGQQQSGPTPGQIFGAFGALIDAANGGGQNTWGQPPQGGHNNGHPGQPGHHDGPGPQHGPWHPQPNPYPGPQPGPWHPGPQFGQMQKMNSIGSYSTSSDAEAAKNNAVRALGELRLTVMEARVEYNSGYRFVIVYSAREPLAVVKYQGGTYSTSSDARQAADQTAAALKAKGNKVIIETPVYYNGGYTYTIGYVSLDHYQDPDDQLQTYNSIGAYSTSSEASAARDAAVRALGELRLTVLEARVMYNAGYRFVINYNARQPLNLERYNGGAYSTSSAARQAADQTVAAMRSQGNIVVVEAPVYYNSGYTYSVSYVTRRW